MAEQPDKIIEIREELLVSARGGNPIKQTAHFIKPILSLADETPEIPTTFLPLRPISLNCTLNGWRTPTQQWISWVDRLHSSYQFIWKRAGIYEAILSSKYKIVKNEDLFFGLAERWCCETNTFVFPWGEATITLEDVTVLGGYSVLGDSVSGGVDSNDFAETEKKLLDAHLQISRGSSQKANQGLWMKHFMSLGGDSGIEHEAFISLWLSRFVLPTFPYNVIVKRFFKIAICLARGVAIALAPVVLASIYRDLSLLKSGMSNISSCSSTKLKEADEFDDLVMVTLWAPLHLVQVWAWERFPEFRPNPKMIECGEPRLARWHDVNEKDIGNVRPLLQSAGNSFEWRPYCKNVDNLPLPIFYKDTEEWVVVGDCLGDDINTMVRLLRVCELVGMDTTEQYNPNRVAMQFGFDQDVPKKVKRDLMNSDIPKRELVQLAWLSYINPIKDQILHFPSKFYEPKVTLRYLKWLRQGVLARHAALDGLVRKKRSTKRPRISHDLRNVNNVDDNSISVVDIDVKPIIRTKIIDDHLDVPPGFMSMNVGNDLDVPPGFPPPPGFMSMNVGNDLDVPPGFPPQPYVFGKMPDVPPGFTPKSNVVGEVADVPPGFTPKSNVVKVEDVPPGFTPKSNDGRVNNEVDMPNIISQNLDFPSCFSPKSNERPTAMCVEKRNGYLLKSEVNIKKECVDSIEKQKPMLMCGYQTSPAETEFKEGLLKKKGRESSGKSEHVNGETAQSLAHGKEGKSDRNSQKNASSDLEARIRQLERMVAELTQAR